MSMKICEAYGDENGKGSGGKPGDQTGRELRYRAWYKRTRGWNYVLIPKNAEIGRKAANLATDIVKSRLFGYDKGDRWTILTSLQNNGGKVHGAKPAECDCSTLVSVCYILNGVNVRGASNGNVYTGNIRAKFLATGEFEVSEDKKYLDGTKDAPIGSVYVGRNNGHGHTLIVVESSVKALKPDGSADNDKTASKLKTKGSVRVRTTPVTGDTVTILYPTDEVEIIGVDEKTGWYKVRITEKIGYITNNKKYVDVR